MSRHIPSVAGVARHVCIVSRQLHCPRRTFGIARPFSLCVSQQFGKCKQTPVATLRHRRYGSTHATPVSKQTFNKMLIANRGEIACRIIKTARRLGIRTVAVYTNLDSQAPHVKLADETVCIGNAQSYLSISSIVQAAVATGSDAVHPGYGFLSENPAFVQALQEAKITFVGPTPDAIAAMGDKIQSKQIAEASGVNCIPGFHGEIKSTDAALKEAHRIGYPVMVKASAGGGGKGMRIAWNDEQLLEGYKLAKQESLSAFADDRLLIEKYIDSPRHIEIQVLGDKHGNVIYLPPRECSIQRRNQKVIEESPSVHIDHDTWRKMGEQAVALSHGVKYNSAGTVEFLVDKQRNFYFLEMNTRLQVEHPVTEMVSGLDLVEHMLYSAAGHPLAIKQSDVSVNGWAIESRVYAEDPTHYLPSVGRLLTYKEPPSNEGARCDSGVREGSDVPVEYDPLLCKLTTHGKTRQEAIERMIYSLDRYVIRGVTHNIPLLQGVVRSKRFQSGENITTNFLAEEYPEGYQSTSLSSQELLSLAAVAGGIWLKKELNQWIHTPSLASLQRDICVQFHNEQRGDTQEIMFSITRTADNEYKISSPLKNNVNFNLKWNLEDLLACATVNLDRPYNVVLQYLDVNDSGFRIQYRGDQYNVSVMTQEQRLLSRYMKTRSKHSRNEPVTTPMPGKIISIAVKEGDKVAPGAEVAVVEAMKMQNVLRTPRIGVVKKVLVQPGSSVKTGQVLIEFQDDIV